MRSRLKGLDTKDRVKTLVKRSMTNAELKEIQRNIDALFEDQELYGFSDPRKIGDQNPYKSIKSKLDKLNTLNNPIAKNIDDDIKSLKSMKSSKSIESKISKKTTMIKSLQDEVNKEKAAKNNALNILLGLKQKNKDIDMAI